MALWFAYIFIGKLTNSFYLETEKDFSSTDWKINLDPKRFGWVSLFNGISSLGSYLMPMSTL